MSYKRSVQSRIRNTSYIQINTINFQEHYQTLKPTPLVGQMQTWATRVYFFKQFFSSHNNSDCTHWLPAQANMSPTKASVIPFDTEMETKKK